MRHIYILDNESSRHPNNLCTNCTKHYSAAINKDPIKSISKLDALLGPGSNELSNKEVRNFGMYNNNVGMQKFIQQMTIICL